MFYLTLARSIHLLRISVSLIFFLHALVRILNNTISIFGGFLEEKGFIYGNTVVWLITVFELAGSLLLAFNQYTKLLSLGFIAILLIGVILIHFSLGWFVGEHGTGGTEYSFILITALLTIIAADQENKSRIKNN